MIKIAWCCIFTPPIRLHGVERFNWAFLVLGDGAKIEHHPFLSKSSYMIGQTKRASLRFMRLSLICNLISNTVHGPGCEPSEVHLDRLYCSEMQKTCAHNFYNGICSMGRIYIYDLTCNVCCTCDVTNTLLNFY